MMEPFKTQIRHKETIMTTVSESIVNYLSKLIIANKLTAEITTQDHCSFDVRQYEDTTDWPIHCFGITRMMMMPGNYQC
uniref:Uncharacterized protein n=1 Tax=Onchocerca volvulus TaxID=6282 RepID=A0A8R1TM64_ONCVO